MIGVPMHPNTNIVLPVLLAGFRSPADDHKENRIDFNTYFRRNRPSAIVEYRIKGSCMEGAHLPHGALVIVDCSLNNPTSGSIVAATVNGEDMVKQLQSTWEGNFLVSAPADGDPESVKIEKESDCKIWGTITHVILDIHYPIPKL